jgi:opacity protein-like surface antigen
MLKRLGVIILIFGLMSVNAVAGPTDAQTGDMTGISVKKPFGVKINTGYIGTKMADPGWRYVDSYNWLGAGYIEGTYTVYKNTEVFLNSAYSEYAPSQSTSGTGPAVNFDFTTYSITAGARYGYPLWRWFVPYAELGVGSYMAFVTISEDQQTMRKQDIVIAPEVAAGFYVPLMVPTDTRRVGMNIQCSFGLIRDYLVKPLKFDFGYLGNITMDGQRLTIGFGVSF